MKKAWGLLIVAAFVGVGLRYAFPKDLLFPKEEKKYVDDFLAETMKEVEQDTIAEIPKEETATPTTQVPKEKPIEQTAESGGYLDAFFAKLYKLEQEKKGQVRIAFFGDSMLDADMLVMQFRHYLQRHFGGNGVGFVPITSVSASGRYSIKHQFSPNWHKQSFLKKNDTIFSFGVTGETFFVGDTLQEHATLVFRRGSAYKELPLINPKLLYGKRRILDSVEVENPMVVLQTEAGEEPLELNGKKLLNSIQLPSGRQSLQLAVSDQATVPFYGVSFASQTGIIVDNLAVRGNSGLTLTRLQTGLMRQFQKEFDYDLIILSYGTNVFNPKYTKGFGWYGKRMKRVVKHLKNCFGGADVIVMSMADRALKIDDEMQTPPELHDFIRVQKRLADSTQSAFFSLYDTMGGAGSMKEWVEAEPPLANKDYTHFNSKGAEKAGRFFYDWLMKKYAGYLRQCAKIEEEKAKVTTPTHSEGNTQTKTLRQ